MDTEKVGIFNENGVFIGSASKKEALDKNLRRGIARVFLLNKKGFLYVQKRGENMEIAPGVWDQSAGGHIDSKEKPEEAALRELKEELGIKLDSLNFVTSYSFEEEQDGKVLYSFDFIFTGQSDEDIHIQKEELSGGKWFSISELKSELSKFPERFAPGFRKSFPVFLSTING